ncbi:MAG TPA: DUF5977 domain-containing protein [Chitinophagaceae bacterium]|nr:DUF5977 domain-containing protein [Chitinophagaceae bacterium]
MAANAQQEAPPPGPEKKYIPNVLPKSPEAAAISRYGNYEVNLFSGLPSISIPLYEIKVGALNVPISINYHAGGNKVSDMASWVGLGWSLSNGGSINRRVMGRPDEVGGGYLNGAPTINPNLNLYNSADNQYLAGVLRGDTDAEPDIYSYSFPGRSGKFLFKQNGQAVFWPQAALAINRIQQTNTQVFDITDEGGNLYKFGTFEMTYNSSGTSANDAPSTWWPSHMISANKQDTIFFSYTPRSNTGTTDYSATDTYVIEDQVYNYITPAIYTQTAGSYYTNITWSTTNWQLITEIRFKDGRVVFEQAAESREDLISGVDAPRRLNAIKVFQLDPKISGYRHIKTIRFYHSYFQNPSDLSKRLRLDSVYVTHPGETEGLKYRFSYNTSVSLPNKNSTAKDYWGYFNNANNTNRDLTNLKTLIPTTNIQVVNNQTGQPTQITIGSQDPNGRNPNPSFMQAYVLNKIVFPTGGSTEFEYETNQYLDDQSQPKFAGGLRVKTIKSYDDVGSLSFQKEYKYGNNESGYGRQNFVLSTNFFKNESLYWYWGVSSSVPIGTSVLATKRVRTFFANSSIDLEPADGAPVVYPTVTEYYGSSTSNAGKTIYEFTDRPDGQNTLGNYGKNIITTYHVNRGQLAKKLTFKRDVAGNYVKISSTGNVYQAYPEQWNTAMGVVAFKARVNQDQYNGDNICSPPSGNGSCYDDVNSLLFSYYSIRSTDDKLIATTDTVFNPQNPSKYFHTYKRISYDNTTHWQPTAERTLTNVSDTLLTTRKYVPEYSTGVYPAMTTAHIYDKVVEEESILQTSSANTSIGKTTTNYGSLPGNNYLPISISQRKGTFADETRAFFSYYDNRGNILQMNKASDIYQSYIWDYQMMSPVAEVKNASQADISYTSFEAQNQGNWSYSGVSITNGSAPTGRRVYHLPSGSITRTGLYAPTTYVLSYWNNAGSAYSISGTVGGVRTGRTRNGWTYYEHKISGQASVTISGSGLIDELRMYPEKAQMTTMTYEPLIGVSSVCDVNSKILYYEYDELGRLILIRDQDRNIVKKVCYNYWQQAENCNVYYNTLQSGTFTKNNCSAGATGSAVTYSVPQGTYSSTISPTDANNKAIADVNANGQAYANALGTCTAPMIQITARNSQSVDYNIRFTNTATGVVYNATMTRNTPFSPYNLISLPAGTYNVQFSPRTTSVTTTFRIGTFSQYASGGVTFFNVSIASTMEASM